jgi:hypothetical protein
MPNWCYNRVEVFIDDPEELEQWRKTVESKESKFDFNKITPMPEELNTNLQDLTDAKSKELIKKYGADGWYKWRLNNWGCKWGVDGNEVVGVKLHVRKQTLDFGSISGGKFELVYNDVDTGSCFDYTAAGSASSDSTSVKSILETKSGISGITVTLAAKKYTVTFPAGSKPEKIGAKNGDGTGSCTASTSGSFANIAKGVIAGSDTLTINFDTQGSNCNLCNVQAITPLAILANDPLVLAVQEPVPSPFFAPIFSGFDPAGKVTVYFFAANVTVIPEIPDLVSNIDFTLVESLDAEPAAV